MIHPEETIEHWAEAYRASGLERLEIPFSYFVHAREWEIEDLLREMGLAPASRDGRRP